MIIVTGGAGFIGSSLIYHLNTLGEEEIVVVDRLESDDKWKNLRGLRFERYIHADRFFDHHILEKRTVRALYHMGSCSSTLETDVDFLMRNNLNYSQKIFRLCTIKDIPLVYGSTSATYGAGEHGYSDDENFTRKLIPLSPYGYSKKLFDDWVIQRERKPSRWYGVKLFNVYGPNEYHKGEMKSLVCKAFEQIQAEGRVRLYRSNNPEIKDGEQSRDFIYVKDAVAALVNLVSGDDRQDSGIYNLGRGQEESFLDLVRICFKVLGKPEKIEFIDMPKILDEQYQNYTKADMAKFHTVFPDFKFHSLEEGVRDYIENYLIKKNPYFTISS